MKRDMVALRPADVPRAAGWATAPRVREQHLRAQLAQLERRGEIAPGWQQWRRVDRATGQVGFVYARVKEPALRHRPMPRYVAAAALAATTLTGLGVMLWQARYVLLAAGAGLLLLAWAAVRLMTGHSPGCAGLHCPGCRG